METKPFDPSATSTRLGTVWPRTQLRFEASGRGTPDGQTVRKLGAVASVAVTFTTTAIAAVAGTRPWPAILTLSVCPGPIGAFGTPPVPSLVSMIRAGVSAW